MPTVGWKGLKKKATKAKYRGNHRSFPEVEVVERLSSMGIAPFRRVGYNLGR
jgi:hypothetical protein